MRDIVVHSSGLEIDLQEPSGEGEQLLRAILRREERPRCKRGELMCQRHGSDLYLSLRGGASVGCHWPGSGCEAEPHSVALMSTEHKVQVEYIARAAEREGLPFTTEKTLPTHVRPDLVVNSDTAFEVQRSHITTKQAKTRTTKAVRGGMSVSLWISDKPPEARPAWLGEVPSVVVYAPDWRHLPSLGEATITRGLRRFSYIRHDRDTHCEQRGRCGGWHLRHEPASQTLDRLSVGLVVGDYVPVQVDRFVQITTRSDVEEYGLAPWSVARKLGTAPRDLGDAERIQCRASTPVRNVNRTAVIASPPPQPVAPPTPRQEVRCQHWIGAERRYCNSDGPTRQYLTGWRCELHTPTMTGGA